MATLKLPLSSNDRADRDRGGVELRDVHLKGIKPLDEYGRAGLVLDIDDIARVEPQLPGYYDFTCETGCIAPRWYGNGYAKDPAGICYWDDMEVYLEDGEDLDLEFHKQWSEPLMPKGVTIFVRAPDGQWLDATPRSGRVNKTLLPKASPAGKTPTLGLRFILSESRWCVRHMRVGRSFWRDTETVLCQKLDVPRDKPAKPTTQNPVRRQRALSFDDEGEKTAYVLPDALFSFGFLRLGLADDRSGYRRWDLRWDLLTKLLQYQKIEEWVGETHWNRTLVRGPAGADARTEYLAPWGRVFIHLDAEKWRFLFALNAGVVMRGINDHTHAMRGAEFFVCLPVTVERDECKPLTKTFRGLPLDIQEHIWAVPGMSMALAHALNTLSYKMKSFPQDLARVSDEDPPAHGSYYATTGLSSLAKIRQAGDDTPWNITGYVNRKQDTISRRLVALVERMAGRLPPNRLVAQTGVAGMEPDMAPAAWRPAPTQPTRHLDL